MIWIICLHKTHGDLVAILRFVPNHILLHIYIYLLYNYNYKGIFNGARKRYGDHNVYYIANRLGT